MVSICLCSAVRLSAASPPSLPVPFRKSRCPSPKLTQKHRTQKLHQPGLVVEISQLTSCERFEGALSREMPFCLRCLDGSHLPGLLRLSLLSRWWPLTGVARGPLLGGHLSLFHLVLFQGWMITRARLRTSSTTTSSSSSSSVCVASLPATSTPRSSQ